MNVYLSSTQHHLPSSPPRQPRSRAPSASPRPSGTACSCECTAQTRSGRTIKAQGRLTGRRKERCVRGGWVQSWIRNWIQTERPGTRVTRAAGGGGYLKAAGALRFLIEGCEVEIFEDFNILIFFIILVVLLLRRGGKRKAGSICRGSPFVPLLSHPTLALSLNLVMGETTHPIPCHIHSLTLRAICGCVLTDCVPQLVGRPGVHAPVRIGGQG
jgi:hypothetical protein